MAQPQPPRVSISSPAAGGYTNFPTAAARPTTTLMAPVRNMPPQQMQGAVYTSAPATTYSASPLPAGARIVTGPLQAPVQTVVRPATLTAAPQQVTATRTFTAPVFSQAPGGPVAATVIRSGAPLVQTTVPMAPSTLRVVQPASAVTAQTRPHTLAGPGYTQGAYEAKHQDDPQLRNLKELRKTSGLKMVPVSEGLRTLKESAVDGKLSRELFLETYAALLEAHGVEVPEESVCNAVFDLFDRDDNNVVDMMELICGISLLCSGSEDDKIHAVFDVFDENGDGFITMDEMFKFLTSVFKVVLTPNVMGVMNSMGVAVESAEDLASVTSLECFKTADLNHDGKLSVAEFKNWFYAPRNDPSFLFSPVRKLLQ